MTCKHCGASISEHDVKCPYCDSYIDHGTANNSYNNGAPMQNRQGFRVQGPDEPQPIFIVISLLIPLFGFIIGAVNISGGHPKSGRLYLILGAVSFFLLFCGTFMFPMMFMLPFFHMK
ncbi:hypothetical protein [Ruminococcus flavefaciens]|uniref:hypothetical protein n=1 Tax=Ruminococcus flavefaciens TaxID=1265 RepID=UPI0025F9D441|nr:hypothetical protein [Ruminococcus flavefaciens]